MKPVLVLIILLTLTACSLKNNKKQIDKSHFECFDFYFYESTGDNIFIEVNNVQHAITFNMDSSNKDALSSLFGLKWNVLYPNSNGTIKVYGYYNKHDSSFILIHWWLKAPFKLHQYISDSELLEKGSSPFMQKEKLSPEDFNTDLHFSPEKYNVELAPQR
ncbi:hypothetical protein [Flavipsychrobacter stenotrophus]|nr:hypothetical protein [Flavipsychrobacter stenotrophus]